MSVKYDFFETPKPKGSNKRQRLHARVVQSETLKTDTLAKLINDCCSVTTGDIKAVLDALRGVMVFELGRGNRIHLDGFGYFQLTLTCPPVQSSTEIRAESVNFKSVAFRPEAALKKQLKHIELEKTRDKYHSNKLSEAQFDQILTRYFQDHDYMTSKIFQRICGLTWATANRRLKKLVEEGRLEARGHTRLHMYYPVEGNYGK